MSHQSRFLNGANGLYIYKQQIRDQETVPWEWQSLIDQRNHWF